MLDMTVTFKDLGLIAIFVIIAAAGIFLIRVLIQLGNTLRGISKLVNENAENLDKIIKDLPTITANAAVLTGVAGEIAENLVNEQELIENALENVNEVIEAVTETVKAFNDDLIGGIKKLANTLSTVVGFITKRKGGAGAGAESAVSSTTEKIGQAPAGAVTDGGSDADGNSDGDGAKPGRRVRKPKKPRKRNSPAVVKKNLNDKDRRINIHIRQGT